MNTLLNAGQRIVNVLEALREGRDPHYLTFRRQG